MLGTKDVSVHTEAHGASRSVPLKSGGGENVGNFYGRIRRIKQLLLDSEKANIAIISHGGIILNLISDILDIGQHKAWALKVDRGSVSTLSLFENGTGVLSLLNFKPGGGF